MRRPLLGVVAFGVVIALAGCGSSSQSVKLKVEPTVGFLAKAAERTSAAQTGHFEMTMTTDAEGKELTVGGTGSYDDARGRLSMELDLSSLAGSLGGSDAGKLGQSLSGKVEMRFVDGVIYMKMPFLTELAGGHTEWISMDPGGMGLGSPDGLGSGTTDPSAFLDYLRGAGGTVEDKGHEPVRGVDTTHLASTITLRKSIDGLSAEQKDKMLRSFGKLGGSVDELLDTPMPVDVYVDDSGMVRRLDMAIDMAAKGKSVRVHVQIEFFDFGTPVEIEAPPADQVTSMTEKLSGFGSTMSDAFS
jgi:hypothetical protein